MENFELELILVISPPLPRTWKNNDEDDDGGDGVGDEKILKSGIEMIMVVMVMKKFCLRKRSLHK